MRVFIGEKPSVAAALAAALGGGKKLNGYYQCGNDRVTWCFGHMLEQVKPDHYLPDEIPRTAKGAKIWRVEDLPIVPQQWVLAPKASAAAQLKVIKTLLREADEVVNAGDPDREGQLLIDEILEEYRCRKPVRRFLSSALDEVSVKKALKGLKDNDDYRPMGQAALARSRADWLVGMNLTRAFTLANRAVGNRDLLTVGRVQSPTLRLVVDRDRTIAGFRPVPFFKPYADIGVGEDAKTYRAWWVPGEEPSGLDEQGRLLDESIAQRLSGQFTGTVTERTVKPRAQRHPTCYSLADIQFSASKIFGYSAEQTLDICQALYETHKLTTYPRVDTGYLPESQHVEASAVMETLAKAAPEYVPFIERCDLSLRSKTWDDSKVSAHHGIIPTMSSRSSSADLKEAEKNVYDLIVRRYIAQFYPPYRYEETVILHDIQGEIYRARGRTVIDPGWRHALALEVERLTEPSGEEESPALPVVQEGQSVSALCDYTRAKTTPPSHFTEGTLIRAMEQMHKHVDDPEMRKLLKASDGIGTSATRGNILADLKRRGFLAAKGKHLISTELGQALIDALPSSITDPVLSARAEEMLREIEQGRLSIEAFLTRQTEFVVRETAAASTASIKKTPQAEAPAKKTYTCPVCKQFELTRTKSKKDSGYYWLCKGVFESEEAGKCRTFLKDKGGKPVMGKSGASKRTGTRQKT